MIAVTNMFDISLQIYFLFKEIFRDLGEIERTEGIWISQYLTVGTLRGSKKVPFLKVGGGSS